MSPTAAPPLLAADQLASAFRSADNPVAAGPPLEPFVAVLRAPRTTRLSGPVRVDARETTIRPHPALPALPVWGYGLGGAASSPGPLFEVAAGRPQRIRWRNRLAGTDLPYLTSVVDGDTTPAGQLAQNEIGTGGGMPQDTSMAPLGWLVTHLHGAHVGPESDGWPDHMMPAPASAAPPATQPCEYPNDDDNGDLALAKVGNALWYHDHAMDATRYHVYAGLFGPYLVRHPGEALHGLPVGRRQGEAVLLLQDRNLGVDGHGRVRLLHKVTTDTAEFFGPLTFVNGLLWPRMTVSDGVVRLRLYNGANARTFRLHLLDQSGGSLSARLLVIGTEGGLLWRAAAVTDDLGLTLAPAERLDLLVDLRDLAGQRLYLVNSAPAPFSGAANAPVPPVADLTTPRPDDRLPFPQVLRLDVEAGPRGCVPGPVWDAVASGTVLNPAYRRLTHPSPVAPTAAAPAPSSSAGELRPTDGAEPPSLVLPEEHGHHLILLSESDPPGHLELTEVAPDPTGGIEVQLPWESTPTRYRDIGSSFYDTVGVRPVRGVWQVFTFLNLTGDTHPLHIHQSTFQPLRTAGTSYTVSDAAGTPLFDHDTHTTSAPLVPDPAGTPRPFEPAEVTGWKDTIRVDPEQLMSVAVRFDRVGRYVYHCHILEHEDHVMMRPLVVTPLAMSDGDGAHHH